MTRSLATLITLAALALTSCGEAKVEAKELLNDAKQAVSEFDFEKLSPEKLKPIAEETLAEVLAKLRDIKDDVAAKSLAENLQPVVDKLIALRKVMGENLPDLTTLETKLADLKERYADDEKITAALKPLLDRAAELFR